MILARAFTILCIIPTFLWAGVAREQTRLWSFEVPPSAVLEIPVEADWREFGDLDLYVRNQRHNTNVVLFAHFYFITKQDLWFETREPMTLNGKNQFFRLSLNQDSPDWQCRNARRTFDVDVLRWVCAWGIKVFSAQRCASNLEIGELHLRNRNPLPLRVYDVQPPLAAHRGALAPVRFRLDGFTGNPYATNQLNARLIAEPHGESTARSQTTTCYFRQDYLTLRPPGSGTETIQALERPYWQADWQPESAGPYELSLMIESGGTAVRHRLPLVHVLDQLDQPAPENKTSVKPTMRRSHNGPAVFQFNNGAWTAPDPDLDTDHYWHAPLTWTPDWGHYLGPGEFDQLIAWQWERQLHAQSHERACPALLFSEDELDDFGKYNWKDHPLNQANGGHLARSADWFSDEKVLELMLQKAHYMVTRFGRQPGFGGLLIRLNRPYPTCTQWINEIAYTLSQRYPDVRILSDNPGLPQRRHERPLYLYKHWNTDPRLAANSIAHDKKSRSVTLDGMDDGMLAMATRKVQHWAGARVLSLDILPKACGSDMTLMFFFRTGEDIIYQSELVSIRPDEWQRVYFHLDRPDDWMCAQDPQRRMTPYELLNLHEIGLRLFSMDCDAQGTLQVGNCRLLWEPNTEPRPPLLLDVQRGDVKEVPQYSKFELDFTLNRIYNNPYNPNQIDVSIQLIDPAGQRLTQPGFFLEPWELVMDKGREKAVKAPPSRWCTRVTPWIPGRYQWLLTAHDCETGEKAQHQGSFVCKANPDNPGFLRKARKDPRYFEFDNGDFYYPIGLNLRSPTDRRPNQFSHKTQLNLDWADAMGTYCYHKWFHVMNERGQNFCRIWMCSWWLTLEWNSEYPGYHGLSYYNQANAARLDRIMELAQEKGIYVNLETTNHGMLSTDIDDEWDSNPLNMRTFEDGYLQYATDFFDSAQARQSHIHKLRYIIARWGYSPAIAWWGVITECEWVEAYYRGTTKKPYQKKNLENMPQPFHTTEHMHKVIDWNEEVAEYLRRADAHPHMVSTHFSVPTHGTEVWARDYIDIVHNNAYTTFTKFWERENFTASEGVADIIHVFADIYRRTYCNRQPLIIGEWGGSPIGNTEQQLQVELHTGNWAMLMTETAGVTGFWWWNLVDAHELYNEHEAIARYMEGEDHRGKDLKQARAKLQNKGKDVVDRQALILYNKSELFGYIFSNQMNQYKKSRQPSGYDDPTFPESGQLDLLLPADLKPGEYRLEYWNTFKGKPFKTQRITLNKTKQTLPVISHRTDLAIKLKPL